MNRMVKQEHSVKSMDAYPFEIYTTLHLKTLNPNTKFNFTFILMIRITNVFQDPHNFMVTALGLSVKQPLNIPLLP